MGKAGRPKLNEGALKRQLSICLTQEERTMVTSMADEVGMTISQVIAFLIRQSNETGSYLELKEELTPEELEELDTQRARVKYKTQQRSENAQNRNLSRRMGLDRGLTHVMVIVAPQQLELPGIFCEYYDKVWIVPYCMFNKLQSEQIVEFPCYQSVMDYFAGNEIPQLQLANFIEEHKEYNLTSEGEKSVLRRLAQVYDSLDGLPSDVCYPEFPEKDPADLPYLKDLTVKGEFPYLAYSDRQKILQDSLTFALQAISQVENQIRFEDAAVAAQTVVPPTDESGNFVKRGRGRPRKTEEAKEISRKRKYLQVRAERMLNKVYKLALYNNEPVNLPPEITHQHETPHSELNKAFINTIVELKAYLKDLTNSRVSLKTRFQSANLTKISELTHALANSDKEASSVEGGLDSSLETNLDSSLDAKGEAGLDAITEFDLEDPNDGSAIADSDAKTKTNESQVLSNSMAGADQQVTSNSKVSKLGAESESSGQQSELVKDAQVAKDYEATKATESAKEANAGKLDRFGNAGSLDGLSKSISSAHSSKTGKSRKSDKVGSVENAQDNLEARQGAGAENRVVAANTVVSKASNSLTSSQDLTDSKDVKDVNGYKDGRGITDALASIAQDNALASKDAGTKDVVDDSPHGGVDSSFNEVDVSGNSKELPLFANVSSKTNVSDNNLSKTNAQSVVESSTNTQITVSGTASGLALGTGLASLSGTGSVLNTASGSVSGTGSGTGTPSGTYSSETRQDGYANIGTSISTVQELTALMDQQLVAFKDEIAQIKKQKEEQGKGFIKRKVILPSDSGSNKD